MLCFTIDLVPTGIDPLRRTIALDDGRNREELGRHRSSSADRNGGRELSRRHLSAFRDPHRRPDDNRELVWAGGKGRGRNHPFAMAQMICVKVKIVPTASSVKKQ